MENKRTQKAYIVKGMGIDMKNHLANETSPYLLQHAENPVEWYPWCDEAFIRAEKEDKPVFLSIGYSTCHWCHVMAHESFEDDEIADFLNKHFISIKVDKEERPDIDSIYMSVCQALTGSGGWPTTIFMTPQQKPFFAGTYFPKTEKYGQISFQKLLEIVDEKWRKQRKNLTDSAEEIIKAVNERYEQANRETHANTDSLHYLPEHAVALYKRIFDKEYGGFGDAPKFPTPHNLLFLMRYYQKNKDNDAMQMAEKTLFRMYRGGMFDHIGGGFSRYSTDAYFLVPHFEKMLYDNALLILAYAKAYQLTKNQAYRDVAEKTASYILREMAHPKGGFYSAQDADSEGIEGKYYLFEPWETLDILGSTIGQEFNAYYDITEHGNFEGKNIPNLLHNNNTDNPLEEFLPLIYDYRKNRYHLHLDDKILTAWNGLMIAAMCQLYRVTENDAYLEAAKKAQKFIETELMEAGSNGKEDRENRQLYVSYRDGKRGQKAFLDDYANEVFALVSLYEATLESGYLQKAENLCDRLHEDFYDEQHGGFFLYGKDNEQLIMKPKETYDGAVPSGNSMMAYNLVRLYHITEKEDYKYLAEKQLAFMYKEAKGYPAGYAMYLIALLEFADTPDTVTIVPKAETDLVNLSPKIALDTVIRIRGANGEYPMKNGSTTFYVCKGRSCKPPVNVLDDFAVTQSVKEI
uniref:thioredoxin domain-containing protein n=1 Tax=Agathobacter sp. TaxID=2021311 RepID=UPI0040567460